MQKHTTKIRFSDADLADAKVRKAAEKAEEAVEKADRAKARLPSKKLRTKTSAAAAEGAKLRFGKKEIVVEEIKKPRPVAAKAAAKGAAASVSGTVHKKASEYEDDNVGVQAANEVTGAAETAVQTGDTVRYSHKLKTYNRAAKLEAKADKANVEAMYQKSVKANPEAASTSHPPASPVITWRNLYPTGTLCTSLHAATQTLQPVHSFALKENPSCVIAHHRPSKRLQKASCFLLREGPREPRIRGDRYCGSRAAAVRLSTARRGIWRCSTCNDPRR